MSMSETKIDQRKFVTTFIVTAPSAATPVFDAIRDAGHEARRHEHLVPRGYNIATDESYEAWQTTMPADELAPIAVEAGNGPDGGPGALIVDMMPTPRGWQ